MWDVRRERIMKEGAVIALGLMLLVLLVAAFVQRRLRIEVHQNDGGQVYESD